MFSWIVFQEKKKAKWKRWRDGNTWWEFQAKGSILWCKVSGTRESTVCGRNCKKLNCTAQSIDGQVAQARGEAQEGGIRSQWFWGSGREQGFILRQMGSDWRAVRVGWCHHIYFRKLLQLQNGLAGMKGWNTGYKRWGGEGCRAGEGSSLTHLFKQLGT